MSLGPKMLEFLDARLESMLTRPLAWSATMVSLEEQILQLLEVRRVVTDDEWKPGDRRMLDAYLRFAAQECPGPEPLAWRLERNGRGEAFPAIMRRFVAAEQGRLRGDLG